MALIKIADELAAVLVSDVLIPGSTIRIADSDDRFINLVKSKFLVRTLMLGQSVIAVIPKVNATTSTKSQYSEFGTAATVLQVTGTNWPKPFYSLLVTGLCRIRVTKITKEDPFYLANVQQLEPVCTEITPQLEIFSSKEAVQASDRLRDLLENLALAYGTSSIETTRFRQTLNGLSPHLLADIACQYVSLSERDRLSLLSKVEVLERLKLLIPLIEKQVDLAKVSSKVKRLPVSDRKDYIVVAKSESLSDVLKSSMHKRSVDDDGDSDEKNELDIIELKIEGLPEHVRVCASKEFSRLRKMVPHMPDYSITRGYLEFIVDLPWNNATTDRLDLEEARIMLDAGHYGLEAIKRRLIEFLAVRRVLASRKVCRAFNSGPILCLVGPPGVGKTSIARTLAEVMGRKFQRISLGGVCDHADIRGHRRTYVGAMPGRILQAIKTAGSRNPLILLDEIDKTTPGIHGDPAAALLEVLDAEQNNAFVDHYLNIPFDLSEVIFVTTANSTSSVLPALLDRMEVINVPSYTSEEKVKIVEGYLLPKQLARHGLKSEEVVLESSATEKILTCYTQEAGVRQLERVLETLCRRLCAKLPSDPATSLETRFVIAVSDLPAILGPPRYKPLIESDELYNTPGICLGLAWTPVGGEVMQVEVSAMPGDGKLHLTGQLGDVIKESALLALSWIRSRLGHYRNTSAVALDPLATNIHVHLPSGAVAKDGPSAGLAILASMVSLFAQTPTRSTVAVTGEITLRGYVLPVGGIREKLSAARRHGVKTVVLPSANEVDVDEVPEEVRKSLRLVFVRRVETALIEILDQPSRAFSDALQLNNSHL